MSSLYSNGSIQKFAEKILALGCNFDDDGSIDIFLFGEKAHMANELTLKNYENGIKNIIKEYPLEGGTIYGAVIKKIRQFYFPNSTPNVPNKAKQPVYVMFVTDGATQDEAFTKKQLIEASYEPIFWQFMAIGKSSKEVKTKGIAGFFEKLVSSVNDSAFEFLENLDNMEGRYIDNANFFSLQNLTGIEDAYLFDLMMQEYPMWLKIAKEKGILE